MMDNYSIGLDIGTTSVGWAVIDDQFNLLKRKKKNLFGVYMFDAADTASDRRIKRASRRRFNRRRNRLNLLRELFSAELHKLDPSFLLRLEQSKLSPKDELKKYSGSIIFAEEEFKDKEFYHKYPTIFHLRAEMLLEPEKKFDLREVFLVCSNIIKYRGNFTNEAQNLGAISNDISKLFIDFDSELSRQGYRKLFAKLDLKTIQEIVYSDENASDKQKSLTNYLVDNRKDKDIKQQITEFSKLILGLKANFAKLLGIDADKAYAIKLSDRSIETSLASLEQILTPEQKIIFDFCQNIYSDIVLHRILNGEQFLSIARVKSYDKHKSDLKLLKGMWASDKEEHPKEVIAAKQSYDNYINHGVFAEDFYNDLDKYLKVSENQDLVKQIRQDIERNYFLPKQRTNQNGAIPFQVHYKELETILKNQSKFYPFLLEKDTEGFSTIDKILRIDSFRIPYYVGPLYNGKEKERSKFSWMVRKNEGKIYPWNFDEKVDRDKSSIEFINRMTGTDTYLLGEPVLPKASLIYQKFEVLNELNKVKVNEQFLDKNIKQDIFVNLFKNKRVVTTKNIAEFLVKNHGYNASAIEITGLSKISEFSSSLSSYIDMKTIFGQNFIDKKENEQFLEEIITWLTVFEDKKILNRRLEGLKDKITENQKSQLLTYRYSGWGRLSRQLLLGIKAENKLYGEGQPSKKTILDVLWKTNFNLMQIINNKDLGYDCLIKEFNGENSNDTWEAIENLAGSPAIKKGIRQTVKVVDDIVKALKQAPENIYIEFAREEQASIRTNSRYNQIKDLYANLKKLADKELSDLVKNIKTDKNLAKSLDENKQNLSSEKLYLYFLQGGKSLYSGKTIDINRLQDYEVDHILPRAYIKDDSIDNKALVTKSENQNKTNKLLLSPDIINKMEPIWKSMRKANLISQKKYFNLTRRGISENQQKGFINRQLVETRQIIKNVTYILDDRYSGSGTKVSAVRANLSSEFRRKMDLPKSRNINDYHHAHDAYIAALLGLYISKKYPNFEDDAIYKSFNKYLEKLKDKLKKEGGNLGLLNQSYIISQLRDKQVDELTGEIIWKPEWIEEKVKKIFDYKQMNIVKKTEIRDGLLFKETIFGPGKKNGLIPLKKNLDPSLYGGYSSKQFSYSVLCRIDGNKAKLVGLPVMIKHQIDNGEFTLEEWIQKNTKYKKSIEILIDKVPIYQKVWSKEKGNLILSSATEIQNGQQLVLSKKDYDVIAKLEKMSDERKIEKLEEWSVDLKKIYKDIVMAMQKYYPFYSSEQVRMNDLENIEAFENLSNNDFGSLKQFNLIEEILKMLHQNAANGSVVYGNIKTSAFGKRPHGLDLSQTYLIYQSPTGLFEKRRFIE